MALKVWDMAGKDIFLIGKLHCPKCKTITGIQVGGVESVQPDHLCPQCGSGRIYWTNEIQLCSDRHCLFVVDERENP